MKKEAADEIKRDFDSKPTNFCELAYMSQEVLDHYTENLDMVEALLENEIYDFSLDLTHTLLEEEEPNLIRAFWFSKGMEDFYICIDGDFSIRAMDPDIPSNLIGQIFKDLVHLQNIEANEAEQS